MATPNKALRRTIVQMVHNSGAAHLGTALSSVEILKAVFRSMDLEKMKIRDNSRDRIIFSKGHGTAALYVAMYVYGLLSEEEVNSFFTNGSLLEGHTSHFVPYVEHSTGALGHGLAVSLGIAIGLRSKQIGSRVFAVTGDGELQEGSNWEALMLAGSRNIGNLCLLVDRNRMSQIGEIEKCCSIEPLKSKLESFNLDVFEADGHNEEEMYERIRATTNSDKPVAIVCLTIKGRGVSFMENNNLWHYRCPQGEEYERALKELED